MRRTDRAQNVFFENSTKDRVTHFNISVAVIKSLTVLNFGFHYDFVLDPTGDFTMFYNSITL